MTTTEYLLSCLIEECAEAIQRATKIQRFGLLEIQPGQDLDNQERLQAEVSDLWATLELLRDHGIGVFPSPDAVRKKRLKVAEFMEYSKAQRCLQP